MTDRGRAIPKPDHDRPRLVGRLSLSKCSDKGAEPDADR